MVCLQIAALSFNPYEDEEDEDGEVDEEKEPITSLPGKKKRLGRCFITFSMVSCGIPPS